MKIKELGKDVKVTEFPYGIFLGDGVCFASAPCNRYYVNLRGTEDGFERIEEANYKSLLSAFKDIEYLLSPKI